MRREMAINELQEFSGDVSFHTLIEWGVEPDGLAPPVSWPAILDGWCVNHVRWELAAFQDVFVHWLGFGELRFIAREC